MVAAIAPGGRGIRPDDGGGERQEARSIEVKILPKKTFLPIVTAV